MNLCFGSCAICKKTFTFYEKVPVINDKPVCETCITLINSVLTAFGEKEIEVDFSAYI